MNNFHDPINYKPITLKKSIFTKKYVSIGIYDVFKNGKKIDTIEGEGEANAYINRLTRELK